MKNVSSIHRRDSTVCRHNRVYDIYLSLMEEMGAYAALVPRSYIYERIRARTGLCVKTIAYIINHTFPNNRK